MKLKHMRKLSFTYTFKSQSAQELVQIAKSVAKLF